MSRHRFRSWILLSAVALLPGPGCRHAPRLIDEPQFSVNGRRDVAAVAPECAEVADFVFSQNGRRVIYAGVTEDGGKPAGVWIDNTLLMMVDSVSEVGFTEAHEPYFIGRDSGKAFIYYRYARARAYEAVSAPSFSRDGGTFAYLTANGGLQNLTVENSSGRIIPGALSYALRSDGTGFAYAALDSGDWLVVEGSDTSDVYDYIQDLTYSRNGVVLAFAALVEDEWFPVVNGEELEFYNENTIDLSHITVSSDGKHLAHTVTAYDESSGETFVYVVHDGEEAEVYLDVSELVLSPDGLRVAYVADDGEGQFAVLDSDEGEIYDEVWAPVFDPTGRHLGLSARLDDREFAVVNGRENPEHELVDRVRFSRTGRKFGYGALDDRKFTWNVGSTR